MYGKVFGVGEVKYAIYNFKRGKGVAMATKFRQKISQNCRDFSFVQDMETLCAYMVGFLGWQFKYATGNFKQAKEVAMATKFTLKISQNYTDFRVQEIEKLFL